MTSGSWHVSVLIPARNEEELLPRRLRSVFSSLNLLPTSVTTDVVVAVDRSTNLTHAIAKEMTQGRGVVASTESGAVGRVRAIAAETANHAIWGSLQPPLVSKYGR